MDKVTEPLEGEPTEEVEPQVEEPVEKSDSEKKDKDSKTEIPSETLKKIERWGQQMGGFQKGIENLAAEFKTFKESTSKEESPLEPASDEDKRYADYYKRLGFLQESDVDKKIQEGVASLTENQKVIRSADQTKILNGFVKNHPELSNEALDGAEKMKKVLEKLNRITPEVPGNPNYSLKEDLEWAYEKAFGKSDLEEFRQKAKATGQAEAFEAIETQVGSGSSVTTTKKKVRTPAQEAMLNDFGVSDEQLSKKHSKKES